jgi:FAD:protein FMN transferase
VTRLILKSLGGLCVWLLAWSSSWAEWQTEQQSIMGTQVSVTLWHPQADLRSKAIAAVMTEMRRIDSTYSPYIQTSDLAKLNAKAAQTPVTLSREFLSLIDASLAYSRLSHGAFDITFASLGWHYDYRQKKQPSKEVRRKLLPAINYQWLDLNKAKHTLSFKHTNVRIDLGGIAKGYAVDQAVAILQTMGIEHASVSAGGDSRLLGDRRGRPWMVGIKNPRIQAQDDPAAVISLPLEDVAVSTSGDYERYFIDAQTGERIHHILNPKTGRSANQVMSVTILGPRGIDTDALSTSVFVLGPQKGLKLIESLPGFDAIVIDQQGQVTYSQGLQPPTP